MDNPTHNLKTDLVYSLYPVSPRVAQKENSAVSAAEQVLLTGNWQLAEAQQDTELPSESLDWVDIAQPASVHVALWRAGKISNPWYGTNCDDLQWIQERDWCYRTTFRVPKHWKDRVIRLRFDGIDYLGAVWLDGKFLGSHAGMFGGPAFDITQLAAPGSQHSLVVRIIHTIDPSEVVKSLAVHGTRFMWGNKYRSMGLWQPVRLIATGAAYLETPYVRTEKLADRSADLFAQVMCVNTGDDFSGTIQASIRDLSTGKAVWRRKFRQSVPNGTSYWEQHIRIEDPKIWWPNGYGKPSLYRLELVLSADRAELDAISSRFGIRTLELQRNPYIPSKPRTYEGRPEVWSLEVKPAPNKGSAAHVGRPDLWANSHPVEDDALFNSDESYRYLFVINGRPMYGKGACWMTSDDALALNPEREEWMVRAAKEAGINLFRLNGGNCLFETDRFYDLCDEHGILVWQDLQNCWNRELKAPPMVWREQIKQSVLRLRQHPSLALYCGGNEFAPYELGLIGYLGIAREIIASYDNRPFRMSSPSAGSHHAYYPHDEGTEQAFLDLWIGDPNWYVREFAEEVNFVSEWSSVSFGNLSMFKRITPRDELDDNDVGYDCAEFLRTHPTFYGRFGEIDRVAGVLWSRPSYYADLGRSKIAEMIEYSQMSHAEMYGYVFENWRGQFPYKGGQTVWTYNSHGPVSGWNIIDWFGQPEVPYYAVKRANESVHVYANTGFLNWGPGDTFTSKILAVSDHAQILKDTTITARVFGGRMKEVVKKSWKVDLPASGHPSPAKIISWPIPADAEEQFLVLELTLNDSRGRLLSRSVYFPKIVKRFADPAVREKWQSRATGETLTKTGPWLRPQLEACPTELAARVLSATTIGKEAQVTVKITNKGVHPAYPLRICVDPEAYSSVWSDNYFWLRPGESRELSGVIRLDMAGIDTVSNPPVARLKDLHLVISSWNAPPVAVSVKR